MVAAQHQRQPAALQSFDYLRAQPLARGGDLRQVLGMCVAFGAAFRLLHRDVAQVFDLVSEPRHARVQIGHPQRRRAHIHAAPALS